MEDNLVQVAREIYSKEPKEPCTIEFGLDDCAPPNASEAERTAILFEILMILFLEGVKVKYGEGMTPEKLTPAQIQHLSQYVLSYGFSTLIESDDITTAPSVENKEGLKAHCERFYDLEREKWYQISFNWANIVRANHLHTATTSGVHKEV